MFIKRLPGLPNFVMKGGRETYCHVNLLSFIPSTVGDLLRNLSAILCGTRFGQLIGMFISPSHLPVPHTGQCIGSQHGKAKKPA